jgi:hypothetical protein
MTSPLNSLLAGATSRVVRIGDTMHVQIGSGVGEDAIERTINSALRRGKTVTERGISRWMEDVEDVDATQSGSSAYIWHADGNRVRGTRFEVTKTSGGLSRRKICKVWISL